MPFNLPKLRYAYDALEPHISGNTLKHHHQKHHQGYVDKLNKAVAGSSYADMELPAIVRKSSRDSDKTVFHNAAQAWNHDFLWRSMSAQGGGQPNEELDGLLSDTFGSVEKFRQAFKACAASQFGSGWAWLTLKDGVLAIQNTSNADTPLADGSVPLLTLDVWEHAYYLDYQSRRDSYIDAFLEHLIAWDFIQDNLAACEIGSGGQVSGYAA